MNPFAKTNEWINEERDAGSPYSTGVVLATASADGKPHSRIVDLRLLDEKGALFFTQKISRKVADLHHNSYASMTFWFPLKQRQVNIEGEVHAISEQENQTYWSTYHRIGQLKFSTYAPLSGQPISSLQVLNQKFQQLQDTYQNHPIPMPSDYVGFRLIPSVFYFYEFHIETFSKRKRYTLMPDESWLIEQLSP